MATTDAEGEVSYVDRPLVTPDLLQRREYQIQLADRALDDHSLVCLPTGLGKTTVSLLVTAHRLDTVGGKSLMLAPTKPLVAQHADSYREGLTIPDDDIVVFTGDVSPDDRAELWEDATVVLATPQVIENDLVGNRISLRDVTHCTFDECHRATGDYAYNYIAERYHDDAEQPLVTAMSASPGDDEESILDVCRNLGVRNVEVMTEDDADVAEYTHETDVEWKHIELPETVETVRDALRSVIRDRMEGLKELGVTGRTAPDVSEREIQKIQGRVQELMNDDQSEGYKGMSLLAEVRKLRTAVTYVETQSVESFLRYMERQREAARSSGASKADQRMVSDPSVRRAVRVARDYDDLHPKYRRARILLAETLGIQDGERVIVFTESRDTAETLSGFLDDHFDTERFVGQSDTDGSDGMTQVEQQDTLERFRNGEFEVLVSTSVAEEGLDVPEVDLVLFYEPVPTAIRSIQRKGRTGRQTQGRVVVLLAEDTRDEAYFWKSRQDEKSMEEELRLLKDAAGDIESSLHEQGDLESVSPNGANGAIDDADETEEARETKQEKDAKEEKGEKEEKDAKHSQDSPSAGEASTEANDPGKATASGGTTPQSVGDGGNGPDSDGTGPGSSPVDAVEVDGAGEGDEGTNSAERPESAGADEEGNGGDAPETEETDGRDEADETSDVGDGGTADASGGQTADSTDGGQAGLDAFSPSEGARSDDSIEESESTIVAGGDDETAETEIVIDQRELDSAIGRDLSTRDGIETRLETLSVGDYVLSDRVVVERKTVADFLESLVGGDRSLFEQLANASQHYGRPVVVIEGEGLYSQRNVHPKAIHGALASIAVDFGASVMQTADEEETADLLAVIASREQESESREVSVHGEKQSKTLAEQQEYVVASIADIGPVTARSLLEEFGSVEAVMTADEDELQDAAGVGDVTAERIRRVVSSSYAGD